METLTKLKHFRQKYNTTGGKQVTGNLIEYSLLIKGRILKFKYSSTSKNIHTIPVFHFLTLLSTSMHYKSIPILFGLT